MFFLYSDGQNLRTLEREVFNLLCEQKSSNQTEKMDSLKTKGYK